MSTQKEWTVQDELERMTFFYKKVSEGHDKIIQMCKEGKSLDEIQKVASYYSTIEGV